MAVFQHEKSVWYIGTVDRDSEAMSGTLLVSTVLTSEHCETLHGERVKPDNNELWVGGFWIPLPVLDCHSASGPLATENFVDGTCSTFSWRLAWAPLPPRKRDSVVSTPPPQLVPLRLGQKELRLQFRAFDKQLRGTIPVAGQATHRIGGEDFIRVIDNETNEVVLSYIPPRMVNMTRKALQAAKKALSVPMPTRGRDLRPSHT